MKIWGICAVALLAGSSQAGTIYLCKAYNGATFWSCAHCNQHNALVERIEYVADGIPWDQQVQQAEQARRTRDEIILATGSGRERRSTTRATLRATDRGAPQDREPLYKLAVATPGSD